VGWNQGQNAFAYFGLLDITLGLLLGVAMSFAAATLVVLTLFSDRTIRLKT
jgi:hypothetical protein